MISRRSWFRLAIAALAAVPLSLLAKPKLVTFSGPRHGGKTRALNGNIVWMLSPTTKLIHPYVWINGDQIKIASMNGVKIRGITPQDIEMLPGLFLQS